MILALGALLGLISVAFGAYAEHGLKEIVSEEYFRYLMTAVRYNQINSVLISSIGLSIIVSPKLADSLALKASSLLFITGTVLFSFGIYTSVTFSVPILLNVTPVGGIILMLAWLLLIVTGIRFMKHSK